MIGNIRELISYDRCEKPDYTLYIPLQFWFNRFSGLSLPIIALQYFDVTLSVKLKKFQDCAYIEKIDNLSSINLDDLFYNNQFSIEASLLVDYIFLDRAERKRFAQSSHEYLIDQVQYLKIQDIDTNYVQVKLDFLHPCKEIIWILQKDSFIDNFNGHLKSRWDNYTYNLDNHGLSIEACSLDFNGYSRFEKFNGSFFNYLQPYEHHSNTPADGVYVYSFSLRPEEQQPTGSCNFSRISKVILNLWIDPRMFLDCDEYILSKKTVTLWVFAINHNLFRIINGIGAVVYA